MDKGGRGVPRPHTGLSGREIYPQRHMMNIITDLVVRVLRQAVPPRQGMQHGCSREWKASGVEHSVADCPAAAGTAAVEKAVAELLLQHTITIECPYATSY